MRRGWIRHYTSKLRQVAEALKFFGVASPDAWRKVWETKGVEYRKSPSFKGRFGAVVAWLRQGELEARNIECAPYDTATFYDVLHRIRSLTVEPVDTFQETLVRLCASAGVAVVFVPELSKTGVCGATHWISPTKALIQLSLRYKTDDQLWFTFFHEAGHIVIHGKREVFLEGEHKDKKEDEANIFASNILIEPDKWNWFIAQSSSRSKVAIEEFARRIGIAPSIVVGRLQHEKRLPFNHCNDLKRYLAWEAHEQSLQQ